MQRLLRPKSIALLGGKWVDMMHEQNRKLGFRGSIWHVHPTRPATAEHTFYRSIGELPGVPDAVVVGIPREATVAVMPELVAAGVGGAVCYASGFAETGSDTEDTGRAQVRRPTAARLRSHRWRTVPAGSLRGPYRFQKVVVNSTSTL